MMESKVFYLASAWQRREEMKRVAEALEQAGHRVSSKWLHFDIFDERQQALQDLNDILDCDVFIRFSDNLTPNYETQEARGLSVELFSGGRHFETGVAWAIGKPIIVIGGKQNIFDSLPGIAHSDDLDELLLKMSPMVN